MKRFYRGSLALRVLLVSILFVALPLLVYFLYVYRDTYDTRLKEIVIRLRDVGHSRAPMLSQLDAYDLRIINIIEDQMANNPGWTNEWLSNLLNSTVEGGGFSAAYYIALEGDDKFVATAASDPGLLGHDFSGDRYIEEVLLQGKVSFLSLGLSYSTGANSFDKYFFLAKVVHDPSTVKPIGILSLTTPVEELIDQLIASDDSTYTINFSLVSNDNVIVASGDPGLVLRVLPDETTSRSFVPSQLRPVDIKIEPIDGIEGAVKLTWKGQSSIGVEVPVKGTDLSLLLTASESEVFGDLRDRLIQVFIVFVAIFIVGGGIAYWITQQMSKPLVDLCQVMNRVSRGDLTARVKHEPLGFEINAIGDIFNKTIDSLRDQMARAEAERVQKETLDQEFKIGRDIQMAILPQAKPEVEGAELAARYIPAKQVGGDFYDIYARPNGDVMLTVADASGKGISACLYSLLLRSMLRAYAVKTGEIDEIMRAANNLFCEDTGMTGMFVTALAAIYHPKDLTLTHSSCGHTPGYVRHTDGSVDLIESHNLAMGVLPFDKVEHGKTQLQSGDLVVLYTDGITETHNELNELYGDPRLLELIQTKGDLPVEELAEAIVDDCIAFRGTAAQFDDITLMLMRVE